MCFFLLRVLKVLKVLKVPLKPLFKTFNTFKTFNVVFVCCFGFVFRLLFFLYLKGVGGFKAIYSIFPAEWSWQAFWALTAFLSIMLGVLNLLPIPVLDGGHVMFLLYEMISGKAPNEKFLERAQLVGFILLIAMVLSANINDWI